MPDWYYSIEGARSGPYSDDDMQRFAASGRFNAATLCWNAAFGDTWKPIADTPFRVPVAPVAAAFASPPIAASGPPPMPPALPPQRGGSRPALIAVGGCVAVLAALLVALPLLRSAPAPALRVAQDSPPPSAFATPPIVAPPAAAPPGQATPATQSGDAAPDVESRLPKCASGQAATEVKHFADTLDSLTSAGLKADSLVEQQQVSSTADLRSCKGTMVLSDSTRHAITYTFATQPNAQFYVRIVLSILPTCPSQNASKEVLRLANTLESLRSTGRTAVSLSGQTEVSGTPVLRSCSGSLLISDGSHHSLTYSFEQRTADVFARIDVQ